ncbi:MAG: OmpA family protein [Candidatus Rokuibacteriota bacterium]
MPPITRVLALALALLPLGCAPHAEPSRAAAVTAPAPTPPPAPAWPDGAPVPDALDAADPAPSPEARPMNETFATRAELPDVHFASGEVRVRRSDLKALDGVVAWLKAHPDQLVIVEGHTDAAGPRAANLALAERRARGVMDYLLARGVAAERVTAVARGEGDTVRAGDSSTGQGRNRRVHFLVRESGPLKLTASPSP